mmetsp:Transcript_95098/g.273786  ORF Transcript_95098/g.273786 Transcript_95098/m.273786 type:complete len:250 (-) Transcript_95098:380-1129(-)
MARLCLLDVSLLGRVDGAANAIRLFGLAVVVRPGKARGMAARPHRLSSRRRRHARAAGDRLPPAELATHSRPVPRGGPHGIVGGGRGLVPRHPGGLRRCNQRHDVAAPRLGGCVAVANRGGLPPGAACEEGGPRRLVCSALLPRTCALAVEVLACAVDGPRRGLGTGGRALGRQLPRAHHRRSRRGEASLQPAHAALPRAAQRAFGPRRRRHDRAPGGSSRALARAHAQHLRVDGAVDEGRRAAARRRR